MKKATNILVMSLLISGVLIVFSLFMAVVTLSFYYLKIAWYIGLIDLAATSAFVLIAAVVEVINKNHK